MRKAAKLIWSKKAKVSLKNIYHYIKKDSPQAAEKVRTRLVETAEHLLIFPEKFPKEELLKETGANFRSISVWHYKIVYELYQDKIIVSNIFDTFQDPEKLKDL